MCLLDFKSRERQLQPTQSKLAAPEARRLGPAALWEAGQEGAREKPVVFYSMSISHPAPYMLTLLPSSENTESSECDGATL